MKMKPFQAKAATTSKNVFTHTPDDFKPLNYQQRSFMKAFSSMNPQFSHVDRGSVYAESGSFYGIQQASY